MYAGFKQGYGFTFGVLAALCVGAVAVGVLLEVVERGGK